MLIAQAVGLIMVAMFAAVAARVFYLTQRSRTVELDTKWELFVAERGWPRILAGEICPESWGSIIEKAAQNPHLKGFDVIAGPWILIEDSIIDNPSLFRYDMETRKHVLLNPEENIWKIHPLFRCLYSDILACEKEPSRQPRVNVWVKRLGLPKERHFYLGEIPRLTCIDSRRM